MSSVVPIKLFSFPKDVQLSLFEYLPIQDLAQLFETCRFARNTFPSSSLRVRHSLRVFNGLKILHLSERITLSVFRRVMLEKRDDLVPHIVDLVQKKCLGLLRIALTSEKMTMELRGDAVVNAAKDGQLFAIKMLLIHEKISDWSRSRAVIQASRGGHLTTILTLLANGPGPIFSLGTGSAVSFAAQGGYHSCIQALLANGQIIDVDRERAVWHAILRGHLDSIKELLKDLYERPSWLNKLIKTAQDEGREDIVAFLESWVPKEQKS